MNYMYEMTGEIKETPWEDYGVKVPQIAWQTDRKEEEEEMESPYCPASRSQLIFTTQTMFTAFTAATTQWSHSHRMCRMKR